MKNLRCLILLVCIGITNLLYAQGVMIYKGNDYTYYAAEDVDSIVFVDKTPEMNVLGGHKFVDLGLKSGTLWATCNVGADFPEQLGKYFSWGELMEKAVYSNSTYDFVQTGNTIDLSAQTDVANKAWGSEWRMPTHAEFNELLTECEWSWEEYRGVKGSRVTGPNGNSIFLPAGSYKDNDYYDAPDSMTYGSYWGRTHGSVDVTPVTGTELVFGIRSYDDNWNETYYYYEFGPTGYCRCGRSVRPVWSNPIKEGYEDCTSFIVNSSYDKNDYSGWDGTPLSGAYPESNAEHYEKEYDTYQQISGLKSGRYRLSVQAFYRKGNAQGDYEFFEVEDTMNNNALLYASTSVANYSQSIVPASLGAITYELGGNTSLVGENLYMPDNMLAAHYWFEAGYYVNELLLEVGDDGVLTIGVKKEVTLPQDWTMIDNWKLIYLGE